MAAVAEAPGTGVPLPAQVQANPITKKLNKILDSKIETDQELLDALETVSPFLTENTLQRRRNLRRDLEQRSLETNIRFLNSFRKVRDAVEGVTKDVDEMSKCCEAMTNRLRATKEQTRDLLNQTTSLQNQSKRVEKRAEIVTAFLGAFQLKPEEAKALRGTADGGIDRNFFPALNRVREIHADCKQLLRTSQHAAALEIMEKMAAAHEAAYELLYRWIQRECRLLNVDFVDLNPLLYQAFEAMQERPVLFKYSLDEYNTARRSHVVRAFIDALTRGGPGGVPKPIELLSHDPLRYVGDMLAWVHQAMASERETLQTLLKACKPEVLEEYVLPVLSHITEGLCRPFKVRVEQALSSENQPVALYRLSNLFTFYANTIRASLQEDAALIRSIEELKELTLNMFFSALNSSVQRMLEKIVPPDTDLLPVQGVHQILLMLRDVLESHDAALVTVTDKKENFTRIFATVLDPMLQTLLVSATQLSPLDVAVYMLNCLSSIYSVISLYQYTDDRLEMIKAQMEANEDVLVSEQATAILKRTGMIDLYSKAAAHQPKQGPLSAISGMEAPIISSALGKFDVFLAKPDSYQMQQCSYLTSAKLRASVQKRTIENVLAAYGILYAKLIEPANNYPQLPLKSFDQVRELLV